MKTPNLQPGTKKTAVKNYTSAFLNEGAVSLDIHAPVRGVNFGKIVSFLIDHHSDTLDYFASNDTFDAAAHDAAWERMFGLRLAAMSLIERSLTISAMGRHVYTPEHKWDGWEDWSEARRVAAVTRLVETVTRMYILDTYLHRYSQQMLDPCKQILWKKVHETHFCPTH